MPVRRHHRIVGEILVRRPKCRGLHDGRDPLGDCQTGKFQRPAVRCPSPRSGTGWGETGFVKRALLCLGLAASIAASATESTDFDRYKSIIDRAPFGAIQSAPTGPPNWAERWQYVGNTVSNSGNGPVQAILFDKESNRSHF